MSPWIVLSLYTWLQLAVGQNIPETDLPPFIPDCEGDVLFLTDSSGSVSYKEFSQVKAFVADLIQPFTFGPQDVQTSVIHISTVPVVEFPFDQHASSESVQRAIRDMKQRMGDTNTGQALYLAKEKIFTDEAGARPSVPKVLVWVTDGISTDDISQPMELLKDMGVTVFIVSTGRGNYLELSQAASQPTEKHLHFVDVDDLHIITKELRDDIIEVIRAQRLKALDVTPRSFRLTWPRLLSVSTGYYVVEYAPMAEPHRKLRMNVAGDQTEVLLRGLAPGTTYNVTLIPESNEQFVHHQNIKVTTLKEVIWGEKLKALDINATSFRLTWPQLLSIDTGYYVVEYTTMTDPQKKLRVKVAGDQTGVVLKDLAQGTRYNVTLILDSNQLYTRPQTIQVSTLKEVIWTEDLKVLDVTSSSFRLTWPRLLSINTGHYVVEYAPVSEPHRKVRMNVPGDHTGVVVKDLAPGTRYKVTVTPESRDQYTQSQAVQVTTSKEVLWTENLKVLDVTPSSFRLTWPRLLFINSGYYLVEYAPVSEPHRKVRMNVTGDQTGVVVRNLAPGISYTVTVKPESNEYIQPQTVQVTTLKEVIWTENLKILDVTPSSFRLTWPQLLSINTGYYLVEYAPVYEPHRKVRMNVTGDQTGVVVRNLAPGISYTVTVKPESKQYIQPQTVQVTTLKEVVWIGNLKVLDVTPSSFRLTWPRLLSTNTGYYVVEYMPVSEPHRKVRMNVPGDQTGVVVMDLAPGISYTVTVTPESNEQYIQPQTVQVTTSKDMIWTEILKVIDVTHSSFRLTWPRLLSINTGYYVVEYAPVSAPHRKVRMTVAGDQTGVVVRNLAPGTSYTVTVTPESREQYIQPQTVQVTTLKEVIWTENLKVLDVTPSSFRLTWPQMLSTNTGYYLVEYAPVSQPHRKVRMNVTGDQTGVVVRNLAPGISYTVTVKPESKQYIHPQTVQVTTLKEVIWTENLKVLDVTPWSFRLTWPQLLSTNTGYYVVEYTPVSEPHRKVRMNVPGDQTGVVVMDLAPGISYTVTVMPESNEQYIQPQTVQVTTSKDMIWTENLKVSDVTHSSFRLTWPRLLSINTGYYVVEYAPVSEPHRKVRMTVAGDQTGVVVRNLAPGTSYTVTVTPESRGQYIQPQTVQVTTLKEVIWTENLKVLDVTPSSFRLTWPQLLSINTGYYLVEYAPVSEPHRKVRMNVTGDQTGVVVRNLAQGISYTVTVKPESKQYIQPQTVQVTTLKEVIWTENLKVLDVTPWSFRLTWPQLLSIYTGYYQVEYAPISEPDRKVIVNVAGDRTGVEVQYLAPGTIYKVTVTPTSNEQYIQPKTVQVTTLKEVIWTDRLKVFDVTASSFRVTWPRLLSQNTGYYVVEYTPVAEPEQKRRMLVADDQTGVVVRNLAPGTKYNVTVIPESNEQYIPPQAVQVTTLEDQISPAQILISKSSSRSFQVSWSPTPDSVVGYQILYGPLPGNSVKLLEVDGSRNSTIVDNLSPNTTYLVTVTALYKSGQEKALSAKACTEEENSRVRHLHLEDMGNNMLKVTWDSAGGAVVGYRVRCRRQAGTSSLISVTPKTHSVLLPGLTDGGTNTICVKPVYRNKPGKSRCKKARLQPATLAPGYPMIGPS